MFLPVQNFAHDNVFYKITTKKLRKFAIFHVFCKTVCKISGKPLFWPKFYCTIKLLSINKLSIAVKLFCRKLQKMPFYSAKKKLHIKQRKKLITDDRSEWSSYKWKKNSTTDLENCKTYLWSQKKTASNLNKTFYLRNQSLQVLASRSV